MALGYRRLYSLKLTVLTIGMPGPLTKVEEEAYGAYFLRFPLCVSASVCREGRHPLVDDITT